jgi:hypothetical protein
MLRLANVIKYIQEHQETKLLYMVENVVLSGPDLDAVSKAFGIPPTPAAAGPRGPFPMPTHPRCRPHPGPFPMPADACPRRRVPAPASTTGPFLMPAEARPHCRLPRLRHRPPRGRAASETCLPGHHDTFLKYKNLLGFSVDFLANPVVTRKHPPFRESYPLRFDACWQGRQRGCASAHPQGPVPMPRTRIRALSRISAPNKTQMQMMLPSLSSKNTWPTSESRFYLLNIELRWTVRLGGASRRRRRASGKGPGAEVGTRVRGHRERARGGRRQGRASAAGRRFCGHRERAARRWTMAPRSSPLLEGSARPRSAPGVRRHRDPSASGRRPATAVRFRAALACVQQPPSASERLWPPGNRCVWTPGNCRLPPGGLGMRPDAARQLFLGAAWASGRFGPEGDGGCRTLIVLLTYLTFRHSQT